MQPYIEPSGLLYPEWGKTVQIKLAGWQRATDRDFGWLEVVAPLVARYQRFLVHCPDCALNQGGRILSGRLQAPDWGLEWE